ncbi:MAG TPA: hypothetical protein PLR20_05260 [Syntrophales bacterium]|jgi:hypothetical protein|nr:hypothetical protein [Syntrophales bacterium]HPI56784.1 hypothetical protein [Syntrophales bacterium]HPN25778.1 hypothetical protein [Syntrophales bacterium]HQM28743.1 hypothetical protein [Syntrophales bacterium]
MAIRRATRNRSRKFLSFLKKINDHGLYQALYYAGEGDVCDAAITLANKLSKKGFQLTSYQSRSFRNNFDRCWAVYEKRKGRPREYRKCLYCSKPFYNIGNTKVCGGYKELMAFENKLKVNRRI